MAKVKTVRQLFLETIGDKHQAHMAKFGAILALGIIDAGVYTQIRLFNPNPNNPNPNPNPNLPNLFRPP